MSIKIAVTIPIYKKNLSENEIISFSQALRVLKNYDIILVCPNNLNIVQYENIAKKEQYTLLYERFDNIYFEGIDGYNKLMVSIYFYKRFFRYEYILIYQLDCFVFRDELQEWASKGYDYVGAPWLHNDRRTWWTLKNKIKYKIKAAYNRYLNKPIALTMGYYKVGNGGFSLRKVNKCYDIISKFENKSRFTKYQNSNGNYLHAEDVFWGCEVNRYYPNIKIPTYKKALNFAFDMNPSLCYELNNNKLPFGCHAWYRYEQDFWLPFIKAQGYTFNE